MVLPDTYTSALLLAILSMICWGSWANTKKLTGDWRFELFYFDYAIGVSLVTTIAAFTFGIWGYDGLLFTDELLVVPKRSMLYAALAGVVFNLANMLLVAAIAIAGMAVAFPVGIGLAFVIGVVFSYILNSQGSPGFLFTGVALVTAAIVVCALAYQELARARSIQEISTGRAKSTRVGTGWKGIAVSIAAGILMGFFYPIVELSKSNGLGPYGVAFFFGIGVLVSTFIFNIYFMNLPIEGSPIGLKPYFQAPKVYHVWGLVGGIVWGIGGVSNFVASSAPPEVQVGPAISYALGQGATMISAIWGVFVWKEFAGAGSKANYLLGTMFLLFVFGLLLVSLAPVFSVAPQS
jgi:glucose uptake protein